jgi:hypothetical protein
MTAAADPGDGPAATATSSRRPWIDRLKAWGRDHRWLQWPILWGRSLLRTARIWQKYGESKALDRRLCGSVPAERQRLRAMRKQYRGLYRRPLDPPLISIVIPTYNRREILLERTLPTLLAQDYPQFEIVIVGDHCTDDTASRLAVLNDPRVRFENRAQRQDYPVDRARRHLVAGVDALNRAIELARGDWIAQCDDDELFVATHLRTLWEHAERHGYEYVWGCCLQEVEPGLWIQHGSAPRHLFDIPHSTLMYRSYLRCFPYDPLAWQTDICHDRHRLRRMRLAGVRGGFLPQVVTLAPLRPNTTRAWGAAEDLE